MSLRPCDPAILNVMQPCAAEWPAFQAAREAKRQASLQAGRHSGGQAIGEQAAGRLTCEQTDRHTELAKNGREFPALLVSSLRS